MWPLASWEPGSDKQQKAEGKGEGSSSCCKICLIHNSTASIRVAGLVNSQQIWAGFKQMDSHHRPKIRTGRVLGWEQGWGLDTDRVWFHRHFSEYEGFVDPRSRRKPNGGYPRWSKAYKRFLELIRTENLINDLVWGSFREQLWHWFGNITVIMEAVFPKFYKINPLSVFQTLQHVSKLKVLCFCGRDELSRSTASKWYGSTAH